MNFTKPVLPIAERLSRIPLARLLLGVLLAGLCLRAICRLTGAGQSLSLSLLMLLIIGTAALRLLPAKGWQNARESLREGWACASDWLAVVSWKRLAGFCLFAFVAVAILGESLFEHFAFDDALIGLLFGLLAIWIALRTAGAVQPASRLLQRVAALGWGRMLLLSLLTLIIAGELEGGFNSAFRSHTRTLIQNAVTDMNDADEVVIDETPDEAPEDGSASAPTADSGNPDEKKEVLNFGSGKTRIRIDGQGIRITQRNPDGTETEKVSVDQSGVRVDGNDVATSAKNDITVRLRDPEREGGFHPDSLALIGVLALIALKLLAGGKRRAEQEADTAREDADLARLQREAADAKLAAMQAQIEPHFLFNTLASIDQLIQSDPARASHVQKSLIQYLRAAIPQIRDDAQRSSLGKQLEMSRAYLEIMQVRMEERLQYEIRISEGLYGAEFPSMMLQTLIENAIKHGLEPRPEGGALIVSAEVGRNRLIVSVEDNGMGCGDAAEVTGTGLANIRERLRLLYGDKAGFSLRARDGGGALARIELPYLDDTEAQTPRG
jgi:hypothetical protein